MKTVSTTVINPKQVITIFNILRSIGLNTSHRGTKYLNKAIQIMIMSNNDVIIVEDIYKSVANIYGNITPKQVKNDISYAISSRVECRTIQNFEKVFGFEYDHYYFTNKTIIEEVARIIKKKFINQA